MRHANLRFIAWIVLALLGAPVAMHVVVHDLHDHHDQPAAASLAGTERDHEHPIVSSPAPQIPALTRIAMPLAVAPALPTASWARLTTAIRNVVAFGALRMDDDIGLHSLHATFLI